MREELVFINPVLSHHKGSDEAEEGCLSLPGMYGQVIRPKTVRVHSTEIREAVQEPIQQIVDAVRRALEITPPELASDIVDRGIVMTGGGALIRGLDLLLAQETGLPIHVDEDPLTCVVRGTGRILDDFEKYRSVLSS